MSLRSLSPECKFIVPKPFYEQIYVPEEGNEGCYVDEEKWNKFVSSLKERYLGDAHNYEKFEKLFIKTGNQYLEISKKIAGENLKKKNNKELKELYLNYQNKSLQYAPFIWIQFIINNFFADKAKNILIKKLKGCDKKSQEFYEIALKPEEKAASARLTEISLKWKEMGSGEKTQIYKKFKWIPCLDIHNKPWTKKDFFSHIKEFQKIGKKLSISYSSLLEQMNPSKKERRTLAIARRLAYLKDLKDDFRRQGIFYSQNLFREIARRMNMKLEDVSYMLESEIINFLEDKVIISKDILKERKKGFIISFTKNKKIICKSRDNIGPTLKELGFTISKEFSKEIKGMSACPGVTRGTVTIVKKVSDLVKMKNNYILVAITTHPDYILAMQKAAAIVTDEGGITSHAAITSRELGIPCIVGTKIATRVLKDGDEIKVDAERGIITILKTK